MRFSELVALAKQARLEDRPTEGYKHAIAALTLVDSNKSTPACDTKTSEENEWEMWLEISICAWYVKEMEMGRVATDRLLSDTRVPEEVSKLVRRNSHFYIQSLSTLTDNNALTLPKEAQDGYVSCFVGRHLAIPEVCAVTNPSICSFDDKGKWGRGYLVTCRTVNYRRDPKTHRFTFLQQGETTFHSRTYLLWLNEDMKTQHTAEIKTPHRPRFHKALARGMEDARLIRGRKERGDGPEKGPLWIACTFPDSSADGYTKTALVKLGTLDSVLETLASGSHFVLAEECFAMRGPALKRHEKNWIPVPVSAVDHGDDGSADENDLGISCIYSFGPMRIMKVDKTSLSPEGLYQVVEITKQGNANDSRLLERARGSSCGIPWPHAGTGDVNVAREQLFIIHEVDEAYRYTHRFVVVDVSSWEVKKVSQSFYFEQLGIEYCAGLTWSCCGEFLLISYGVQDCAAKILRIPKKLVSGFLDKR